MIRAIDQPQVMMVPTSDSAMKSMLKRVENEEIVKLGATKALIVLFAWRKLVKRGNEVRQWYYRCHVCICFMENV